MIANLDVFLQQGESQTLEFKKSFGEETLETIGSFANAGGGITLIGVEDDGTVCGVTIGKRTIEDWANQIQNATDPRLQPTIQLAEKNGKQIAIISVDPSSGLPVSVKARFLRRVGRTNQRMSHEEIMQRLYASSGSSWDAGAETGTTTGDLDLDKVRAFLFEVAKVGRRPIPERTKAPEALEKLGLVHSGVPTRAALLLFGKNTTRHFPAASGEQLRCPAHLQYVKLGRFRSPTLIVDDRRVDGGILQQIDDCLTWFRERLQTEPPSFPMPDWRCRISMLPIRIV